MASLSPDTEVFSTPPTTPGYPAAAEPPKKPSLSRKTSRPSNLRLEHGVDDYKPDIVVDASSPGPHGKARSPLPAHTRGSVGTGSPGQPTPRASDHGAALHPAGALTTPNGAAGIAPGAAAKHAVAHRALQQHPAHTALKSPCFVHSQLDKGASLADWLRTSKLGLGKPHPDPPRPGPPMPGLHSDGTVSDTYSSPELSSPEDEVFERDDDEEYGASLTRQLAETAVGVREMSKQLGRARIHSNIQNVLIVTKAKDNRLIKLTRELALYLMMKRRPNSSRGLIVYVDCQLRTSRRFDAAGIEREHPNLFAPFPRRHSSTSSSASSLNGSNDAHPSELGQLRYWTADMCARSPHLFDFVVTLGGDGTVLFTSWLFQRIVPPVLPFALGSLGFLTNFDFADHAAAMDSALEGGIRVNLRMRFTCTVYRAVTLEDKKAARKVKAVKKAETGEIMMSDVERGGWEALEGLMPEGTEPCTKDREIMCFTTRPAESFEILNDLVVDRGPSPYVSQLELFADEHHLTTVQADGLCIATPTGSTAYSLSAGGSLVHPEIPSILITPLCPHTLSFRPMLLPDTMELRIAVPFNSRSTAWASFDGRGRVELKQGDHIKVTASKYPFPTVCADKSSTDWFHSISRTLKWNERERQKSFVVVEENAAKKSDNGDDDDADDGGFDIDVVEDDLSSGDGAAAVKIVNDSLLQPEQKRVGREKTREAARDQAEAEAAARALVVGTPLAELEGGKSGLHSGIDSPDRFIGPHPHLAQPPSRHVTFTDAHAPSASPTSLLERLHSPRAVRAVERYLHGHGHGHAPLDREGLKTPTSHEDRRLKIKSRSRSREARHPDPPTRAFAAWGHDGSESEGNASEDE